MLKNYRGLSEEGGVVVRRTSASTHFLWKGEGPKGGGWLAKDVRHTDWQISDRAS